MRRRASFAFCYRRMQPLQPNRPLYKQWPGRCCLLGWQFGVGTEVHDATDEAQKSSWFCQLDVRCTVTGGSIAEASLPFAAGGLGAPCRAGASSHPADGTPGGVAAAGNRTLC